MKITITMECDLYGKPTREQLQDEICDRVPFIFTSTPNNGEWEVCVNRMIVESDEIGKAQVVV